MNYNPNIHHRRSIRLQGYDYSQAGLYFITICCEGMKCRFGSIENHLMQLNDAGKNADECWLNIPLHFSNVILHEHIVMPNHIHGIIELITPNVGAENILPKNGAENGVENVPKNEVGSRAENGAGNREDGVESRAGRVENRAERVENRAERVENRAENVLPLQNKFQNMNPSTIGSIVKGFKIGVSKWFRQNAVGAEYLLPVINTEYLLPENGGESRVENGVENRTENGVENRTENGVENRAENILPLHEPQKSIWQRNYYEHIIRNENALQTIANYIVNNPSKWDADKFHFKS